MQVLDQPNRLGVPVGRLSDVRSRTWVRLATSAAVPTRLRTNAKTSRSTHWLVMRRRQGPRCGTVHSWRQGSRGVVSTVRRGGGVRHPEGCACALEVFDGSRTVRRKLTSGRLVLHCRPFGTVLPPGRQPTGILLPAGPAVTAARRPGDPAVVPGSRRVHPGRFCVVPSPGPRPRGGGRSANVPCVAVPRAGSDPDVPAPRDRCGRRGRSSGRSGQAVPATGTRHGRWRTRDWRGRSELQGTTEGPRAHR